MTTTQVTPINVKSSSRAYKVTVVAYPKEITMSADTFKSIQQAADRASELLRKLPAEHYFAASDAALNVAYVTGSLEGVRRAGIFISDLKRKHA